MGLHMLIIPSSGRPLRPGCRFVKPFVFCPSVKYRQTNRQTDTDSYIFSDKIVSTSKTGQNTQVNDGFRN